jgi:hypothetical protein
VQLPNDISGWFGIALIIAGFFGSAVVSAINWNKGRLWQFAPPIFGAIIGVIVTLVWWTTGFLKTSPVAAILVWTTIGWVFWFAIWLEAKFGE